MSDFQPNPPLRILLVDDEINIRKTLAISLESHNHHVVSVSNAADAIAESSRNSFDLAFVDLKLGATSGLDLISSLLAQSPWMRVVIMTAYASIDTAVETMKRGAADYLAKPFTPAQVQLVTDRVARMRALEQEVAGLKGILSGQDDLDGLLKSESPPMQRAISLARQVAKSDTTVLIRGESGTGKGLLARAIHGWSARAAKPMNTVSCPSLSPQLLESELFGHVRGAFTGAIRDNPGRIALCDGGTLFLDEIGDLPLELQPKLLRFVQDREYERVGEGKSRRADVRVITATNVDLEAAVKNGRFREDLLYRIQVIQIDLPPLSDRAGDIPRLAQRFIAELAGAHAAGITEAAMAALVKYSWPGNVRELRNVIERAVVLSHGNPIGTEHLPASFTPGVQPAANANAGDLVTLDKLEEIHIRRVLAKAKSLEEAAEILGIDVATLWRRRKKYGV